MKNIIYAILLMFFAYMSVAEGVEWLVFFVLIGLLMIGQFRDHHNPYL